MSTADDAENREPREDSTPPAPQTDRADVEQPATARPAFGLAEPEEAGSEQPDAEQPDAERPTSVLPQTAQTAEQRDATTGDPHPAPHGSAPHGFAHQGTGHQGSAHQGSAHHRSVKESRPLGPPRTRTGPIVWGCLVLVFCAYIAVSRFTGGAVDTATWIITTVVGLGALLLVVAVAVLIRGGRGREDREG